MKKSIFILAFCCLGINVMQAVESVPGHTGNAVRINGSQAVLTDSNPKSFDFSKGFTFSVAIKPEKWVHQSSIISNLGSLTFCKRGKGNADYYLWATLGGQAKTGMLWAPGKLKSFRGKWVLLAVSYDPATGICKGYMNSMKKAEDDLKKRYPKLDVSQLEGRILPGSKFTLGTGLAPYYGLIDEVYIYSRVLSDQEVAQLHTGKAVPADAEAIYTFDDPKNIGKDSSGKGRDLAIEKL